MPLLVASLAVHAGPLTNLGAARRGTLQAVGNVMGSLYLSVLFLGDCLNLPPVFLYF